MQTRILIVEDDPAIRRTLRAGLETQAWKVLEADTMRSAGAAVASARPDVILLDLGLPDGEGVEVVRNVRSWSAVPIIVITARTGESDKLELFEAGADDYITKPFSMPEVIARIRVSLRHHIHQAEHTVLQDDWLKIDLSLKIIVVHDNQVHLTQTEWMLLAELAKQPGALVTQTHLLKTIWGLGAIDQAQYLRVYITALRKKIERNPKHPVYIITETGVGYRLCGL